MGKAARNRRRRHEEHQFAGEQIAADEVLDTLNGLKELEDFRALVADHPELLSDATQDRLATYGDEPQIGAAFVLQRALLRTAQSDIATAWDTYDRTRKEFQAAVSALGDEVDGIDALTEARRDEEALRAIERVLPDARRLDHRPLVHQLLDHRGRLLLRRQHGDRGDNLERSIESLWSALAGALTPDVAADILMHLAIAFAERLVDDQRNNLERSIGFAREALDVVTDPDLRATVQTNLSTFLLRREGGDRRANLREARSLCRAALSWRSPKRDANDWAYTQLDLGAITENLAETDDVVPEAVRLFEEIIAVRERVTERWLVGEAYRASALMHLDAANVTAERLFAAEERDRSVDAAYDNGEMLEQAREGLHAALPYARDAPDKLVLGRTLAALADVHGRLGLQAAQIRYADEALTLLLPTSEPSACLKVASDLGAAHADAGSWGAAAATYRVALRAADLLLRRRTHSNGRRREMQRIGTLHRWASVALARAGAPLEAATVLEEGRTRELRERFDLDASQANELDGLPMELVDDYHQAVAALARAPLGEPGTAAADWYLAVVARIRAFDGFATFGVGAPLGDLAAAVYPGQPLLYVNPAPGGTMLLLVEHNGGGDPAVSATFLDDIDAMAVFMQMMATGHDLAEREVRSYLIHAGAEGDAPTPGEFQMTLEVLLSWMGEHIARPIHAMLAGAESVSLVLCGPVASAPLHAATWQSSGGSRCLLDDVEIRYVPSAVFAATAQRRADQRADTPQRLVALGDPSRNLPGAVAEVRELERLFDGPSDVAVHEAADIAFLHDHVAGASHLHLACHASGGLFEGAGAAVQLADGDVSVFDITTMPTLATRLVAVSACQTAQSEIVGSPDEVLSIGTAMVGAGTACALVSLWPVDDVATALLMVKVYEEIIEHGASPPAALRRAQLWLRDLTQAEETEFLGRHPDLSAEFRRRAGRDDLPGRRSPGSKSAVHQPRPYCDEELWAAFVAVGA